MTKTFPICCTGCAWSRSQIVSIQTALASRSSVDARTLMSSWALSDRSISATTSSVRPLSPMMTTGESLCASARSSLRRFVGSGVIGGSISLDMMRFDREPQLDELLREIG